MNFPLVFIFTLQRKSASAREDYATISKHDFVCLWLLLAVKKLLISKASAKENNILVLLCYDLKMTIHTAHPE